VIDVATGARRTILEALPSGGWPAYPSWSPGGDRIAFSVTNSERNGVYTVRPDGSGLTRLAAL
jgi:Tol biopolymer transport system component